MDELKQSEQPTAKAPDSAPKPKAKPEPEPKAKRVRQVPIRIISRSKGACLVEWIAQGQLKRGYIEPTTADKVPEEWLAASTEYGEPWEDLLEEVIISPSAMAEMLRQAGIWTVADMRANWGQVRMMGHRAIVDNLRQALQRAMEVNNAR